MKAKRLVLLLLESVEQIPVSELVADVDDRSERLISRASHLARCDIVRLDLEERRDPDILARAWIDLLEGLRGPPEFDLQILDTKRRAWAAGQSAAAIHGLEVPPDENWREVQKIGCGAARLTVYAATALVAPMRVESSVFDVLTASWRRVMGGAELILLPPLDAAYLEMGRAPESPERANAGERFTVLPGGLQTPFGSATK